MNGKYIKLFYSLVICLGVQLLSGFLVSTSVRGWYIGLEKPQYTPPDWVFSPIWLTLYVLMAISLWLVWINPNRTVWALCLFGVQLFFNFTWSGAFFYLQNPPLALINVFLLWIFIALTVIAFFKISFWAGIILIPYWGWVSYALYLNYVFASLNP